METRRFLIVLEGPKPFPGEYPDAAEQLPGDDAERRQHGVRQSEEFKVPAKEPRVG
jgi:hypothetical protein